MTNNKSKKLEEESKVIIKDLTKALKDFDSLRNNQTSTVKNPK